MEVVEPGHVYTLAWLDGGAMARASGGEATSHDGLMVEDRLIFVRRDSKRGENNHAGTQCQEVIRALIDRVQYCEAMEHWEGNDDIIEHLREALVLFEARALLRKTEKGIIHPELIATGEDGHFMLTKEGL